MIRNVQNPRFFTGNTFHNFDRPVTSGPYNYSVRIVNVETAQVLHLFVVKDIYFYDKLWQRGRNDTMEILQLRKLSGLGDGSVGAHLTDAPTGNGGVPLRIAFLSLITFLCVCQHQSPLLWSYLSITAPSTFLSTTHMHAGMHAHTHLHARFKNISVRGDRSWGITLTHD